MRNFPYQWMARQWKSEPPNDNHDEEDSLVAPILLGALVFILWLGAALADGAK